MSVEFKEGDKVYCLAIGQVGTAGKCSEKPELYPVIVNYKDGDSVRYTKDGRYFNSSGARCLYHVHELPITIDLPRPERPDLAVDSPILVRQKGGARWSRRHFKEWTTLGSPVTWRDGLTSFTVESEAWGTAWDEWKLPQE